MSVRPPHEPVKNRGDARYFERLRLKLRGNGPARLAPRFGRNYGTKRVPIIRFLCTASIAYRASPAFPYLPDPTLLAPCRSDP